MRRVAIASIASTAIIIVFAGLPSPGYANPAFIWVLNLTVVNSSSAAGGCAIPHNCDLTTAADRAALLSTFGTLQTQSGGKVEQEPSGFMGTPAAGFAYVLVRADGSVGFMTLNGRGLHCLPACDALNGSTPNATDRFVAYKITDTGTHSIGDMLVATAIQDAVGLDSTALTVVGPPSVGGIAEQPAPAALPAATSSGDHSTAYAFGGAALAVATAIAAGGWYARRRRAPR